MDHAGPAVGGVGESVIDGETGFLVRAGDIQALGGAIREALTLAVDDPPKYRAIRRRALAKARTHDVDQIARRTLAVYQTLGGR